ncbi:hypothetical protein OHA27_33420 [Streptomyces sp. NBC_01619]|uniref:hypothetical protein n=1 Tax=Streptomyces sp. NBC_01619 TaxID=2975901 RepID=UPI00225C1A3F|nr:hypothetical protein [Streptomyces sp. NBC_01619]MCX4515135.1 hypothetical protein [Streptomyces sp. NBC_01619]
MTIALGNFPVGLLVDRWSRVKSIALVSSIWSLATLYAWLPSYFSRHLGLPADQTAARTALVVVAVSSGRSCCRSPPTASPAVTDAVGWCCPPCSHW